MSELRQVLATREVPGLLVTSMVGRLPTAMGNLAILVIVRAQHGSYTLAGVLAGLLTVGTALGQPALARLIDRRSQPGVLIGAALTSSIAFAVLPFSATRLPWVSAAAAVVAGLGTPPLEPCLRAQWPRLISAGDRLRAAFSLDVGLQEIVFVSGPILVVGATTAFGSRGGLFACVVTGLIGTLAFAAIRSVRTWRPERHEHHDRHGSPWHHAELVRVFAVAFAAGLPVGTLAIVSGAYAQLRAHSALTGWALAINAAGALLGGLVGTARAVDGTRRGARTRWTLILAVGYLPMALVLPTPGWLLTLAVSGLPLSAVLGVLFQQVQSAAPARMLTEANAWVVTSFGVGLAAANALAGVITDRLDETAAIRVVVLGATVCAALGAVVAGDRSARRRRGESPTGY